MYLCTLLAFRWQVGVWSLMRDRFEPKWRQGEVGVEKIAVPGRQRDSHEMMFRHVWICI